MTTAVGEVYLSAEEIAARVAELGAEIAGDYAGREPLLVGSLKASVIFLADLTRALPILHTHRLRRARRLRRRATGGSRRSGSSRTSTRRIEGRDVLIVEDVVDTGLTLHYLCKTFALRAPALARGRDAARPPVPPARRGPAGALRRLHRPGRVLRRLRLRPRRAVPRTCPTCTSQARGWPPEEAAALITSDTRLRLRSGDEPNQPEDEHDRGDEPQNCREPDAEQRAASSRTAIRASTSDPFGSLSQV